MRVPNRMSYKKWIRYEMIFLLGLMTGVLFFLLFFGKELDRLHLELRSSQNENTAYEEELQKLKENELKAKQGRKIVVEDVVIHILDPKPDAITQEESIRLIGRETKYLEGKSLDSLNDMHLSVRQQFKDRRLQIGDRYIRAELKTMVISKTVHLYFYVKVEPTTP
ncbi:MAG TPA: hypothetical protein VJ824_04425 [Bacillota bacterium]|nr:hypothetical protein [Bacillota bacterium]